MNAFDKQNAHKLTTKITLTNKLIQSLLLFVFIVYQSLFSVLFTVFVRLEMCVCLYDVRNSWKFKYLLTFIWFRVIVKNPIKSVKHKYIRSFDQTECTSLSLEYGWKSNIDQKFNILFGLFHLLQSHWFKSFFFVFILFAFRILDGFLFDSSTKLKTNKYRV